jgi:SnoaL-like polyketide cyclase
MTTKREIVETWFRRVWNEEDTKAIDELFVVDGEVRGLGENSLIGPRDFKIFHATLCAVISDIVITVDKSIEEKDWISAVCTLKANDRKTGAPVGMTGSVLIKIKNGQLVEAYNHWDFIGLFVGLGLLPSTAFEKGLSGEKIC